MAILVSGGAGYIGTCAAPDETVTRLQEIARKRGGGNGTR